MEAKQGLVCPIVRRFKTVQINLFLSNESGGFCGGTYMDTKALQPHTNVLLLPLSTAVHCSTPVSASQKHGCAEGHLPSTVYRLQVYSTPTCLNNPFPATRFTTNKWDVWVCHANMFPSQSGRLCCKTNKAHSEKREINNSKQSDRGSDLHTGNGKCF